MLFSLIWKITPVWMRKHFQTHITYALMCERIDECNLSKLSVMKPSWEPFCERHWLCSEATVQVFWRVYHSHVCLFARLWFRQTLKQPTQMVCSVFRLVSSKYRCHRVHGTVCGLGVWSAVHPAPTALLKLAHSPIANIKLSLGFMCLLPNKFILDQIELCICSR